jgi:tetratricopeptide (TPR) repeat protein
LGAAIFHQALQKDESFSEEQVLDALGEASELLERAIAAEDRSEHADVESKYHFLMGEIQLIKTQLGHPHLLSEAKNHFEHVIADYQSGNSRIWVKAAQSYAHLGLVAQAERQPLDQVIAFYRQAAKIASDQDNELAATYWGEIGEIYFDHELYRESADAYRKASELTTDSQRRTNYQELQKHSEELVDESRL